MTIAFFDLDRTLLDVNSGTLWLREEWRRGALGFVSAARAATWLTRYALGDVDLDRALDHAASVYAGVPVDLMTARVSTWFETDVRHRLRPGAQRALDAHRAAGDAIVLATTSSQFIAASAVAVRWVDGQAGQFAEIRVGNLIQRGAGDDQPFAFDDAELLDLALQYLTRAAHQNALIFQRRDQLDQAADIVRRLDRKNLTMQFDCYHAQRTQGNLADFIENNLDINRLLPALTNALLLRT